MKLIIIYNHIQYLLKIMIYYKQKYKKHQVLLMVNWNFFLFCILFIKFDILDWFYCTLLRSGNPLSKSLDIKRKFHPKYFKINNKHVKLCLKNLFIYSFTSFLVKKVQAINCLLFVDIFYKLLKSVLEFNVINVQEYKHVLYSWLILWYSLFEFLLVWIFIL